MKITTCLFSTFSLMVVLAPPALAGVVLYQNDFESPNGFVDTTGVDISQQSVNDLYAQPGFVFQQINTVETVEINGGVAFGGGYSDPQGLGGDYAIGMLSSVQDDRISLTLDAQAFAFLNIEIDISAIDADGAGGPFGISQPLFRFSLYDSPGGSFNIFSPGTLLNQVDLLGSGTPSPSIFDWTSGVATLSTGGTTDGNVSLVIDLIQSGYAAFDNIVVFAVPEPSSLALVALLGLVAMTTCGTRRRCLIDPYAPDEPGVIPKRVIG